MPFEEVTYPTYTPSFADVADPVTLTESRDLLASDLNREVKLSGYILTLDAVGASGIINCVGPGIVAGGGLDEAVVLPAEKMLSVYVSDAGVAELRGVAVAREQRAVVENFTASFTLDEGDFGKRFKLNLGSGTRSVTLPVGFASSYYGGRIYVEVAFGSAYIQLVGALLAPDGRAVSRIYAADGLVILEYGADGWRVAGGLVGAGVQACRDPRGVPVVANSTALYTLQSSAGHRPGELVAFTNTWGETLADVVDTIVGLFLALPERWPIRLVNFTGSAISFGTGVNFDGWTAVDGDSLAEGGRYLGFAGDAADWSVPPGGQVEIRPFDAGGLGSIYAIVSGDIATTGGSGPGTTAGGGGTTPAPTT